MTCAKREKKKFNKIKRKFNKKIKNILTKYLEGTKINYFKWKESNLYNLYFRETKIVFNPLI